MLLKKETKLNQSNTHPFILWLFWPKKLDYILQWMIMKTNCALALISLVLLSYFLFNDLDKEKTGKNTTLVLYEALSDPVKSTAYLLR